MRRWNGWSPARHEAAQAELVAAGAVEGGRRARAGRTAFVPGPWTELKAPHLPLETAKLAPYAACLGRSEPEMPFLRLLSPVPPHELFAEAWRAARWRSRCPPPGGGHRSRSRSGDQVHFW
ncbi:hypothetical protein [Streptomyces yangpuensis]|uniref:hypothetical protein n=1 Tax=Streptomyces yangpuensis TaxID=1648182 RepID=UPI003806A79E